MRIRSALTGLIAVVVLGCGSGAPVPSGSGGTGGETPTLGASVLASPTAGPTSAPTTQGTASPPDPCTLITKDEAGAAVTKPVSDGVHELVGTPDLGEGRTCTFRVAGGGDGSATVMTFPSPGDLYEAYRLQQSQFGAVKDLAGVGDKAFTVGNGECNVVLGETLLKVILFPADHFATDQEPRMIVLCQQAASRL